MRSRSCHFGLVVVPALLLSGGCGTDLVAPNDEDQQINFDVAAYAADATADDIALMTTEADVALNPNFPNQNACTRIGLFRIRCSQKHFGDNINYTRQVTYYDADWEEMEFFHRDSTEAVNVVVSFEGSRAKQDVEITVDRQRDMTVSNLFGTETERIWNGTGASNVERIRHNDDVSDRVYDFTSTSTVDSVIFAVPREGTWPLSGTITREMNVEIVGGLQDDRTRSRTVVIEFNGTQFATVTVNGETFTFDLETKTIVRDEGLI